MVLSMTPPLLYVTVLERGHGATSAGCPRQLLDFAVMGNFLLHDRIGNDRRGIHLPFAESFAAQISRAENARRWPERPRALRAAQERGFSGPDAGHGERRARDGGVFGERHGLGVCMVKDRAAAGKRYVPEIGRVGRTRHFFKKKPRTGEFVGAKVAVVTSSSFSGPVYLYKCVLSRILALREVGVVHSRIVVLDGRRRPLRRYGRNRPRPTLQQRYASSSCTCFRTKRLAHERPDVLVLDLMLPGDDGLAVCQRLRTAGDDVPVIMLTAKNEPIDRVAGGRRRLPRQALPAARTHGPHP